MFILRIDIRSFTAIECLGPCVGICMDVCLAMCADICTYASSFTTIDWRVRGIDICDSVPWGLPREFQTIACDGNFTFDGLVQNIGPELM